MATASPQHDPLNPLPSKEKASLQHVALLQFLRDSEDMHKISRQTEPSTGAAACWERCFPVRQYNGCYFFIRSPVLGCLRACQKDSYLDNIRALEELEEETKLQLSFDVGNILGKAGAQLAELKTEELFGSALQKYAGSSNNKSVQEDIWKACLKAIASNKGILKSSNTARKA